MPPEATLVRPVTEDALDALLERLADSDDALVGAWATRLASAGEVATREKV